MKYQDIICHVFYSLLYKRIGLMSAVDPPYCDVTFICNVSKEFSCVCWLCVCRPLQEMEKLLV